MEIETILQEKYTAYLAQAAALGARSDRPAALLQRLFGSARNPGDNTLNPAFYSDMQHLLEEYARSAPASAEVRRVMEFMLRAAAEHEDDSVAKWMLIAVQGLLAPLAALLSPDDAAAVRAQLTRQYPRRTRFPVQNTLDKALAACAAKPAAGTAAVQ